MGHAGMEWIIQGGVGHTRVGLVMQGWVGHVGVGVRWVIQRQDGWVIKILNIENITLLVLQGI